MKIIGLCGQSGAGKTTALEVFAKEGFGIIDCDKVSREVCSPGSQCVLELKERFGDRIVNANGVLDRRALADIAFSDPERLVALNSITHTYIIERVLEHASELEREGFRAIVIDAPVLFESGLDKKCDVTVAVLAEKEKRIERIIKRDGISRERAALRIERQLGEKELISLADEAIYNNEDEAQFAKCVEKLARKIGEKL